MFSKDLLMYNSDTVYYAVITQSHPKKSYNWRLGTSFDHTSTSVYLGYP